ncbi:hypothetical protein CPB83DRAFT_846266 [Crepidotus variabilis]|uniref:Uncharacterized protein n=1 Tax=Crepidotus variabilis TaxID=179855 RepID=A0A9P6EP75_9AGAR|nr:hypothetical protein CPB83DRAFT_846266 [Crepidotus variabilis]
MGEMKTSKLITLLKSRVDGWPSLDFLGWGLGGVRIRRCGLIFSTSLSLLYSSLRRSFLQRYACINELDDRRRACVQTSTLWRIDHVQSHVSQLFRTHASLYIFEADSDTSSWASSYDLQQLLNHGQARQQWGSTELLQWYRVMDRLIDAINFCLVDADLTLRKHWVAGTSNILLTAELYTHCLGIWKPSPTGHWPK